ncbi:MAG: hypothetical protein H6R44_358 [Nitrospirae bacterium]|nr:hypothetical protein [Nitrospirota bacterium]
MNYRATGITERTENFSYDPLCDLLGDLCGYFLFFSFFFAFFFAKPPPRAWTCT